MPSSNHSNLLEASEPGLQLPAPSTADADAVQSLDCIYIAASARDGRFTRVCIASVRYFYPGIPIKILVGGPLEPGLEEELQTYWNVGFADLPRGNWGWGFIKLEPLFGPPGERFLILDSDTALGGDVIANWAECAAPFLVNEEEETESETHRLYYDWRRVSEVDPKARPPAYTFNTGHWFGTSGVLSRDDFEPFVDWSTMPPRAHECLPPNDQGVLNYVLNQKIALEGLAVERKKIARWPNHGMHGFNAETIGTREAPPLVIHWAGLKKAWFGAMTGGDVLVFFERRYFDRLPAGKLRRWWSVLRSVTSEIFMRAATRLRLRAPGSHA